MSDRLKLISYEDLDELVDTDPLHLRDVAWALRQECESERAEVDALRSREVRLTEEEVTWLRMVREDAQCFDPDPGSSEYAVLCHLFTALDLLDRLVPVEEL